jgi:23S rRNA pseudouridine2457 synthase
LDPDVKAKTARRAAPLRQHASSAVVLFNKPFGVLCQFSGDGSRPTLKDYLPLPDIYPAGRLDADSEGLVVLTADGALQHRIADPRHKMEKTYWVEVEGAATEGALAALRSGVTLRDYVTRPARVERRDAPDWLWARVPPVRFRKTVPTQWLELTIAEGRNRQVRHMTAAVGLPTLRLIRYRVGPWTLEGLASGEWRAASSPPARWPRAAGPD